MEYYAAVEIFKFDRELEKSYIDNFYDPNWGSLNYLAAKCLG